jgi:hypothetical protein
VIFLLRKLKDASFSEILIRFHSHYSRRPLETVEEVGIELGTAAWQPDISQWSYHIPKLSYHIPTCP